MRILFLKMSLPSGKVQSSSGGVLQRKDVVPASVLRGLRTNRSQILKFLKSRADQFGSETFLISEVAVESIREFLSRKKQVFNDLLNEAVISDLFFGDVLKSSQFDFWIVKVSTDDGFRIICELNREVSRETIRKILSGHVAKKELALRMRQIATSIGRWSGVFPQLRSHSEKVSYLASYYQNPENFYSKDDFVKGMVIQTLKELNQTLTDPSAERKA